MRTNLFANPVSFELIISDSGLLHEFIFFFDKIYFEKNIGDDRIKIGIWTSPFYNINYSFIEGATINKIFVGYLTINWNTTRYMEEN